MPFSVTTECIDASGSVGVNMSSASMMSRLLHAVQRRPCITPVYVCLLCWKHIIV